jgi:hypothetical protein
MRELVECQTDSDGNITYEKHSNGGEMRYIRDEGVTFVYEKLPNGDWKNYILVDRSKG